MGRGTRRTQPALVEILVMSIFLTTTLVILWGVFCALAGGITVLLTAIFYGRSIVRKSLRK